MRIWFRMLKDAKLIKQDTIEDLTSETRTHKIMNALETVCHRWDLEKPYWLKGNEQGFLAHAKTRFNQDNFIEKIDFDYIELSVLEEDFLHG